MPGYDNGGVLFKQFERKSEKAPDYWGRLTVDGTEYELAGWRKDGTKGPFISLKVQPKGQRPARRPAEDDGGDVPF